jgi:hypothetical protein
MDAHNNRRTGFWFLENGTLDRNHVESLRA